MSVCWITSTAENDKTPTQFESYISNIICERRTEKMWEGANNGVMQQMDFTYCGNRATLLADQHSWFHWMAKSTTKTQTETRKKTTQLRQQRMRNLAQLTVGLRCVIFSHPSKHYLHHDCSASSCHIVGYKIKGLVDIHRPGRWELRNLREPLLR